MPFSDADFTTSDFDPEHEALASTREIGSPELPNMHDEPDYVINTSALDRAFPEFSELHSFEEEVEADEMYDNDSEPSMEMGRAVGKSARRLDDSRSSIMSFQNSVRSSSPAVRVEYPTPQKNATARSTNRRAASENLRKDAQLRRANQAQKEHMMSPQVSKNQRDQRRTLSDMHAKVRDNYDGSFLGDERPALLEPKSRSTRFGNPNNSQEIAEAIERASREAYAKEIQKGTSIASPRWPAANNTHNNLGDTMTRNSFLLPDLPNISELVSGVYEDGTPVFSQRRSTRFVSPPHDATDVSITREHMPLNAVPIPEDEKALFVSLRLLQDKVAELEMIKSDYEKKLETYREEHAALKAGKSRHSEKYTTDEAESKKAYRRAAVENQKLEAANVALQNQLDIADRKAQVQEAAVQRLNQERESAVSQLGVAYLESRELKRENEQLKRENAELQSQLNRTSTKKARQETVESEASFTGSDVDDSQMYTERSADTSRSTKDLTAKSARSNTKSRRQDDSRAKVSAQVDKEISRLDKERAEEALFSIDMSAAKRSPKFSRSQTARPSESKSAQKQSNTGKQRIKRVVVEDVSDPIEVTEQSKASSQVDELTLLSTVDDNDILRLRKTLEDERASRKQRRSSAIKEVTTTDPLNTTRQSILKASSSLPRKSSLREPSVQISRPASAAGDITSRSVAISEGETSLVVPIAERPRRHSDHSVASVSSQRKKRNNMEDMTSAFILPDITLSRVELAASNPTRLPEADQRALDNIAQHEGKNCMICKNVLPNDHCNHEPVKVSKPVPVSERMPQPTPYNEEPTMRPSQPPAVALATVLKTLEDELSHLKMQLASYQSAYNKLDASLGKRQRKTLLEKIETVLRDIDMKSDQIYALYDVLEGQKGNREMTEQEMEITLESIGIDLAPAADVTGTTNKSSRLAESDDEEELPWEGIESTTELTGRV